MKGVIIISNSQKRNIFLNKKMILTWNYNKTVFFIRSPLNPRAGFWWARQWYQESKYPNYFSIGIILNHQYQEIVYCENGIENTKFVKNEIIIVIDEAHLAIDKDNPAALNFIYQMVKRIRKYNGAIIITTQNLNDFSGSQEIKKKVSAIINNTQYSLIFNLAPQDLNDVADLYASYGGLTSTEKDYIARANKGHFICCFRLWKILP